MEELLKEILLHISQMREDIRIIKMGVASDVDGEGIPDGWDSQEIGGYAVSMTKKVGSNGKRNPVMYLYLRAESAGKKTLTVYPSESHLLPLFVRNAVDWENGEYDRIVEIEKTDVIENGQYVEVAPFTVLRKPGRETEMGIQRVLGGILSLSPAAQEKEDAVKIAAMGKKIDKVSSQIPVLESSMPVIQGSQDASSDASLSDGALDDDEVPLGAAWALQYGVFSSQDEAVDAYQRMESYIATKGGDMHQTWKKRCMIKYATDRGLSDSADFVLSIVVDEVLAGKNPDVVWQARVAVQHAIEDGAFTDRDVATDFYRWAYKKGHADFQAWLMILGHLKEYMKLPAATISEATKAYQEFYITMNPENLDVHTAQWGSYLGTLGKKSKSKSK